MAQLLALLLVLATGTTLARVWRPPIGRFDEDYGYPMLYLRDDRAAEDTKIITPDSSELKQVINLIREEIPTPVKDVTTGKILKNLPAIEESTTEGSSPGDTLGLLTVQNTTDVANETVKESKIDFMYQDDDEGEVVSPQGPQVIGNTEEKIVLLRPGVNITLDCKIRGFPTPKVVWMEDKQELSADLTHEILEPEEQDHSILARSQTIRVGNYGM
ncbi:unnamed protein product [Allacma fusca]|uniref:Ig-like domain-containing protein n=1 Tax=Allacma fusca TaxID=39272 RepID=A0A8J2JFY0_9HEXA|nr:unnamed protein product [Allacma fusca]